MKNKNQNSNFFNNDSEGEEDYSSNGFSIYNGDEGDEIIEDGIREVNLKKENSDVLVKNENAEESDLFSEDDEDEDDYPKRTRICFPNFKNQKKDEEDEDEESDEDVEEEEEEIEEEKEESGDQVVVSKVKIALAKKLLENIKENNEKLINLFGGLLSEEDERLIRISRVSEGIDLGDSSEIANKIVEGVFDGENMIGPDGKQYSVPSNYASKSKLVEGDLLKLTITDKGTFVYKQTKPVERRRVVGVLEKDEEGSFTVLTDGKKRKVLTASITYFKGEPGDEVVILVPKDSDSAWGSVENIIKKLK